MLRGSFKHSQLWLPWMLPYPPKYRNYSAALYLRLLNSHLIGFLALAKERVRLLPFGWHPGTQLLGAHLNSY
ncbi:MAG: hypothetical protein KZQ62_02555 [Candidatus Thiodiazotropha sp. (ex Lucinoma aequizonata)]|nr:hypothetical protein [Candidatus Thiodiazotropha sp. (ex Lucinoma aequizonata)]